MISSIRCFRRLFSDAPRLPTLSFLPTIGILGYDDHEGVDFVSQTANRQQITTSNIFVSATAQHCRALGVTALPCRAWA
ncbi:hypothetical protein NXS19_001925 [Fusarium pseudograminearum]|nr:hypothetical protein NXS19_001925 [Fusarium pseudograminearum]